MRTGRLQADPRQPMKISSFACLSPEFERLKAGSWTLRRRSSKRIDAGNIGSVSSTQFKMMQDNVAIDQILSANQDDIVREWLAELTSTGKTRGTDGAIASLREATEMLQAVRSGIQAGGDAA